MAWAHGRTRRCCSARLNSNETIEMDDPEETMATVAHFVEQLHANMSSPHEKELITVRLLGITRARKEVRTLIGSHAQAMPLFISILRSSTHVAKVNIAATLSIKHMWRNVCSNIISWGTF